MSEGARRRRDLDAQAAYADLAANPDLAAAITYLELPNELNAITPSGFVAYLPRRGCRPFYPLMKGNPTTAPIQIVAPSMASDAQPGQRRPGAQRSERVLRRREPPRTVRSRRGRSWKPRAFIDVRRLGGALRRPEQAWWMFSEIRLLAPSLRPTPAWAMPTPRPTAHIGIMEERAYLDSFRLGLLGLHPSPNSSPFDQGGVWGIVDFDLSPQATYQILQSMTALLLDLGPSAATFTTAPLAYTVTGATPDTEASSSSESDGSYWLATSTSMSRAPGTSGTTAATPAPRPRSSTPRASR